MTTQLMILAFLALFFGLAWHNQPARKPRALQRSGTNPNESSRTESFNSF
jgi:hypothetical protein